MKDIKDKTMKNLPMFLQLYSFAGIIATSVLIAKAMIDPLFGLTALLSLVFTFVGSAGE
jgi:hypothetical protein